MINKSRKTELHIHRLENEKRREDERVSYNNITFKINTVIVHIIVIVIVIEIVLVIVIVIVIVIVTVNFFNKVIVIVIAVTFKIVKEQLC